MATQSTENESWDRFDLSQRGFFYDEDSRPPKDPLPSHVEALRESMLDFAFDLASQRKHEAKLTDEIKKSAKTLEEGKYPEDNWENFFRKYFFDLLVKDVSVSQEGSRRASRCNYYYDAIVATSKAAWVTFDKRGNALGDSMPYQFKNKKRPSPDHAFYFPIYHLTAKSHIPGPTDHTGLEWHKAPTPSLVESFSWSKLKRLYGHGLRPSPFHAFKKRQPLENDMKCYPWLVVEHKHKQTNSKRMKEEVYCQAVNGSGCAVRLNQIAAKYAIELDKEAHIPPIPAVTTVGPEVKVWITYFAKDFMGYYYVDEDYAEQSFQRCSQGYMMQCIWEGDMTDPHDIIKFRLIVENTYTWATRVFKPLITTYIDQWSYVYSDAGADSAHSAMTRRKQKMELSKSALSSTQRETLAREVDHIIAERLGELDLNYEGGATPRSGPRRSPRLPARSVSRPCTPSGQASQVPDVSSRVETVASLLKATMAAGELKRREGESKFLEPPPEIVPELSITSEDADDGETLVESPFASSNTFRPIGERSAADSMPGSFPAVNSADSFFSSDSISNEDGAMSMQWQNLQKGIAKIFLG